MNPLPYYIALICVTAIIVTLTYIMCKLSKNICPAIGMLFIYYWTFYGAWFIVSDLSGGDSGKRYFYLFDKMFQIDLNIDYMDSILYYAIFTITVQIVSIIVLGSKKTRLRLSSIKYQIEPSRLLIYFYVSIAISFLIVGEQVIEAAK